jgi:ribosomal protein L37AE/L43A
MLKIVEIAKAWIAAENPTDEQRMIAEHRVSMCDKCPYKEHNKMFDIFICNKCGCPINKKIFSPQPGDKACPDQRWVL